MNNEQTLYQFRDFKWNGIEQIAYKSDTAADTFKSVTRQNIFESTEETQFDMRYFEIAPGGFTTLEKHEHVHVVVAMRGEGKVILDDTVLDVAPHDLFVIPSQAIHQLINTGKTPFGFICTVNGRRDAPVLLTRDEMTALKKQSVVCDVMCVPDGYFDV